MDSLDKNPFAVIRGRTILAISVLALLLAAWLTSIVSPGYQLGNRQPIPDALMSLWTYFFLATLLTPITRHSGLDLSRLFGRFPSRTESLWTILMAIPLLSLSIGALYVVYLPLSYIAPGFVQWWLIDDPLIITWRDGAGYQIANLINFLDMVVLAPFVEEFIFRGLLLHRWETKWGTTRAITLSSLLFGLFHIEVFSSIIFGYVAAVLYIRTRSLFVPILVHISNNFFIWIVELTETFLLSSNQTYTLAQFQSEWWHGALGLMLGIPWVIAFWRHNRSSENWQTPYSVYMGPALDGCKKFPNVSSLDKY